MNNLPRVSWLVMAEPGSVYPEAMLLILNILNTLVEGKEFL